MSLHLFSRPDLDESQTTIPFLSPNEKNDSEQYVPPPSKISIWFWLWVLTSLSFSAHLISIHKTSSTQYSYETGFATDLQPATSSIALQELHFTGGLTVDDSGNLTRNILPGQALYAGPPSREIDMAWGRLLKGQILALNGSEAVSLENRTVVGEDGEFYVVMDWVHQLHCLNKLRKALYPNAYSEEIVREGARDYQVHLDHCIDYLRQSVMCQVDITPIPYRYDDAAKQILPDFETAHTCRDFERIRAWGVERWSGHDVEDIVE